jgi:pimeloyl-ACP methyl ester carboxylesterase
MPMTSITVKNPSGERLDVSFHPAQRKDALVILGHGLTGNKDRPLLFALARGLSARGWPCFRISFSGNGQSDGRFEEATPTKEVAVGVLAAARDLRIGLLVSLAGMVHTADFVAREFGALTPGRDLMWDEPEHPLSEAFVADMQAIGDILPAAAQVTQPWLMIHGGADELVPVEDGREAYAAAVCRKRWIEIDGADHSFGEDDYPRIIDAIDEWLGTHFGPA